MIGKSEQNAVAIGVGKTDPIFPISGDKSKRIMDSLDAIYQNF